MPPGARPACCRLAGRWCDVSLYEELVAFGLSLLPADCVRSLARPKDVAFPTGLDRPVGQKLVGPIPKEPVGRSAVAALVDFRMLNSQLQPHPSCQHVEVTIRGEHRQVPHRTYRATDHAVSRPQI